MNAQPGLAEHPARILIVDDERHNRELLEIMLSPQGFVVQTAGSGEEALAMVAQDPPDLILLDVMMPGMDGYEVAVSIKGREATENIPVIMVTALDDRAAKLRGLHAGAEDFLTKPVDRLELSVRVRNLLRLKAYGDFYDEYSQRLEGEVSARTADLLERTSTLEQQAEVLNEQAALLDLAQDAIVVRDMHGRIVFWSRGAEAMYGWSRADALGQSTDSLLRTGSTESVAATIEETLLRDGQWTGEAIHYTRDGTRLVVDSRCALQFDAHHAPVRVLTIVSDITDRKQAAADLLELTQREQSRQDQMRFKDEFLSHVSHELRTPLTAIKQFTSILLSGHAGELNVEQREFEEIVLKNIRQLQSMIDDLLEVTRLETGKLNLRLDPVHIADAVTDTIETLQITARNKGVALSYQLEPGLPSAHADRTRLRQILIILVDNAIKFTPDGGAVTLQARLLPGDPAFVLVEVTDTGCGINPEIGERIFERLYQASDSADSRKGLGLGLYICKALVVRQGGRIWAERRPEQGSVFSFTLPVFSLSHVMAPLLKNDKWPSDLAALLTIESSVTDAWPSARSQEEWSRDARDLIERCLLPDRDVLLPIPRAGARSELFLVAAFANTLGASILADRIQEQFRRSSLLARAGHTLSISYSMLDPFSIGLLSHRLGDFAT